MQIDSGVSRSYAQGAARPTVIASNGAAPADPIEVLSSATDTANVQDLDFTSMTRQEMFDWMNGEIRSGRMTLDESTPFLGMTLKIDVATMQHVDMATDTSRINFMERAQQGIAGARWFRDEKFAQQLEAALARMIREQGQPMSIDATA